MKLVHTAAQARRFVAFNDLAGDFLKMLGVAVLSGLFFSLVAGLMVFLVASEAFAQPVAVSAAPHNAKTGELMFRGASGQWTSAPKVRTDVAMRITGPIARTRLTQTFHNSSAEWAEATYVFPLPENAAVDKLTLHIGDRIIEGQIKERAEAQRTYAAARQNGIKTALVEQVRANLFMQNIANIGPNEAVSVMIEYQQTLRFETDADGCGEYRLRFPLAVTPRYNPVPSRQDGSTFAGEIADGGVAHEELPEAPRGPLNPVGIRVEIDAGVPIGKITSSYHSAAMEKDARGRYVVVLTEEQDATDRDFELVWSPAVAAEPQASLFTEHKNGKDYLLMLVTPPASVAALERMPRETILIVDTSGSMTGTSIEQARSALLMALDRLLPGDRFNVIQFNSVTHALFPGAVFAAPGNLEEARRYVRSLKATGGTEMRPALELALQTGAPAGFVRQVIFMTDGAVGNEDQLIRVIHDKLGASRLFTVGIGAAPNSFFMTKAAQFGRGTFTYIGDVREVHKKMTGLFRKLESPVLKDVVVHWPQGVKAETWPERIPDLYSGEPIVVLAQADHNIGPLYVSGMRGNQPWSMALTSPEQRAENGVGALWARHKIASLMDQARSGADPGKVRASVIEVALEHRLISKYTSMVAVDVTPARPQHADLKRSILPTNTPANWGQQGELPQTATSATQSLIAGSLALLLGTVLLLGKRRRVGGVL